MKTLQRFSDWLFASRLRRRALFILLFLVLIGVIADVLQYNLRAARDFNVFIDAAGKVLAGENIYPTDRPTLGSYLYLPLFAILFIPFTFLPPIPSLMTWTILNIVLSWWIIAAFFEFMTGFSIRRLEARDRYAVYLIALIPAAEFLLANFRNGQTNVAVLAVVIAALVLYGKGREYGSGVLLGLAGVLKIFSLPLVFWMFLRRRFSVVFGALVGLTIGTFVPALILGWNRNFNYISYWVYNIAIAAQRDPRDHAVPFHNNASFQATLFRVFSDFPAFNSHHNEYKVTILILQDEYLRIAGLALMTLLGASIVVYWFLFRNGHRLAVETGGPVLALLCAPLLTPVSEKYHFVFLLPAYLYVTVLWKIYGVNDRILLMLTGVSFAFGTLTLKFLWGDFYSKVWFAYGSMIFCTLFLATAVFRAGAILRDAEKRWEPTASLNERPNFEPPLAP